MSFITGLTRMWLTRTAKPFTFKNGYDQILPYAECENLGLYVHIPFCKSICNFCPYCKVRYSAELCDRYIDSLIQEIHIVGSQHAEHRKATSLYFGGGTPALAANRIKEIVNALSEHFIITEGIGLELHPDNVNVETVVLLSKGEVDSKKIRVEFSLEDMDMSEFQDGATYTQIKDYVLEHSGLKVSNLYISQIKRKCGIEVGKNYNLPKSEDSRQPQCPPEKEKAIREAMKYFGMI